MPRGVLCTPFSQQSDMVVTIPTLSRTQNSLERQPAPLCHTYIQLRWEHIRTEEDADLPSLRNSERDSVCNVSKSTVSGFPI